MENTEKRLAVANKFADELSKIQGVISASISDRTPSADSIDILISLSENSAGKLVSPDKFFVVKPVKIIWSIKKASKHYPEITRIRISDAPRAQYKGYEGSFSGYDQSHIVVDINIALKEEQVHIGNKEKIIDAVLKEAKSVIK